MSDDEQHASEQRDEQSVLLRTLVGSVKVFGGILLALIGTGIMVAIADHFKLETVVSSVESLHRLVIKASEETALRNDTIAMWRATITADLVGQRATDVALQSQVSELREQTREQAKQLKDVWFKSKELSGRDPRE
jgi:hypothetical protein